METRPPIRRVLRADAVWFIAAIALMSWACFHFPARPLDTGLDASWNGVLGHAWAKDLQFGKDVIFTYGPLGLFSVSHFVPGVAVARIFFEIVLGCGIAIGICLLAWRLPPAWRIVPLAYFICIGAAEHRGGAASFLDLGLFAWGSLCFLESGKRFWLFAPMLLVMAAIGALDKFTFLTMGSFTLVLLATDLALRKQYASAVGLLAGFAALFLAGWCAMGQTLAGIVPFVRNSAEVASGYNDAMGTPSGANETLLLFLCIFSFLALATRIAFVPTQQIPGRDWRRILLIVWIAGLMFEEWKYGAVRSDSTHINVVLSFIPMVAFFSELPPADKAWAARASRAAILICMVLAIALLQRRQPGFFLATCLKKSAGNMAESFRVLTRTSAYLREQNERFQAQKDNAQLPRVCALVGQSPVDVFGDNQNYALFNGLNFRPRPCIQSYTAYTPRLMDLDEAFYLSSNAPEYVLFKLEAIDDRFPPLEDAPVLRDLLINYTLLSTNEFPLLRRKQTTKPSLTLLKEGTVRAGEKIDLAHYADSKLWLEIELLPTLFGRLRGFFYKPTETQLHIWGETAPESMMTFNAPARMLSKGFIASPLLFGTDDAIRLYQGDKGQRATAMAVYVPNRMLKSWNPDIRFRVYGIRE